MIYVLKASKPIQKPGAFEFAGLDATVIGRLGVVIVNYKKRKLISILCFIVLRRSQLFQLSFKQTFAFISLIHFPKKTFPNLIYPGN